uniref:Glyco_hydro_63 domain-containing protein n=1 Tax=Rhabditophanes sp. KR3021 TaxID=114890 RepID=A0AC35TWH8_9BILA
MILGEESLKRVPSEFVVQRDDVANPPAFFYLMDLFLKDKGFVEEHMESLKKLHPRMRLWFKWLMSSQKASKSGLFRWRGRLENLDTELNPKTLASGLDDYPRATNPTHQEYHLDLKCWMMMSSQVMSKFDKIVNTNNLDQLFEELGGDDYSEYSFLKENHWDPQGQMFADYGLHSTDVYLKQTLYRDQNGYVQSQTKREFRRAPKQQFVTNAFGYVNLFPLLLKQIPPNAPELEITLKKLGDGNATWSKYGLRSVSKTSPYYGAKNTEHDPGYWRGYIWINLNYMALSALNHYGSVEGPYREMSLQLFTDLRTNIINLISNEYNRTGYVFENYDDSTGMGQGTRPFNGWSSLVLVIMSGDFS